MDSETVMIFIILYCMDSSFWPVEALTCPPRCQTCKSRDFCTTCKPQYWDNRQFVCQKDCPTTCATNECNDGTGVCKKCPDGFYGHKCQLSCDVCIHGLCNVYACTKGCKEGFYEVLDFRGISECHQCIVGCSICSNPNKCDKCKQGYYKAASQCNECPPGCKRCSSRTTCTKCEDGRYGPTCEQVCTTKNCLTCDQTSGEGCLRCQSGHLYEDGECVACSKNCLSLCGFNARCMGECEQGYSGPQCNETCSSYCSACKKFDTTVCTKCPDTFYGIHCDLHCSSDCLLLGERISCMQNKGTCPSGCVFGRYGIRCASVCPPRCLHNDCNEKGVCIYGCKKGYTGKRCFVKIPTTDKRTTHDPDSYTTTDDDVHYYETYYDDFPEYPDGDEERSDRPEGDEDKNQPGQEDDDTKARSDKSKQPSSSHHNLYVYIGLGIGLCVTLLVIASLAGYIVKRRNTRSHNPSNVVPNVMYSQSSNTFKYQYGSNQHEETNADNLEPSTCTNQHHVYDYICDDQHIENNTPHTTTDNSSGYIGMTTVASRKPELTATYDSNGYIEPTTVASRKPELTATNDSSGYIEPTTVPCRQPELTATYDSNGYIEPTTVPSRQPEVGTTYLTAVQIAAPSTVAKASTYEPLTFRGEAKDNVYDGLCQQPDPTYQTVF